MRLLPGKQRFTKLENTSLAVNPFCGLQGSSRESFTAAGGVAKGDRVRRGIEADFVSARMAAGAVRAHINGSRVTCLPHLFNKF